MKIPAYLKKPREAGIIGNVVETAEYGAASYAFGYLANRYRDKAKVFGVRTDLAVGVGLKVVALAGDYFGIPAISALDHHLNTIGNAGVGAYFHTLGAGHGSRASGVKRVLIKSGDIDKVKKVVPDAEIIGQIGAAPAGAYLSEQKLREMAR